MTVGVKFSQKLAWSDKIPFMHEHSNDSVQIIEGDLHLPDIYVAIERETIAATAARMQKQKSSGDHRAQSGTYKHASRRQVHSHPSILMLSPSQVW
jgi:hypothetical protein